MQTRYQAFTDVGVPVQVRRYLIVANQTLASPGLSQLIDEKLARFPAAFHVIVPRTISAQVLPDPATGITGMAEHQVAADATQAAYELARTRLDSFMSTYERLGPRISGEVVGADPVMATREALKRARFDGIIVSTLPPGISRWLKLDLPHRLERAFDIPVTTLVQEALAHA